jgi:hypothetical protein
LAETIEQLVDLALDADRRLAREKAEKNSTATFLAESA